MTAVKELPTWELGIALLAAAAGVIGGLWLTGSLFAWVARATCTIPEGVAFWSGIMVGVIAYLNAIPGKASV